eukprot:TRINITY_DN45808_c0_g1_i1.p1 TRINITY_DN45808_c0_g1~~TRINITY_DN45808_c0_g1_i1.p1  ORF type:complete len:330 (+),score=20.07 TRINITY_DN45808_c0_g1_i1:169-1158(+)
MAVRNLIKQYETHHDRQPDDRLPEFTPGVATQTDIVTAKVCTDDFDKFAIDFPAVSAAFLVQHTRRVMLQLEPAHSVTCADDVVPLTIADPEDFDDAWIKSCSERMHRFLLSGMLEEMCAMVQLLTCRSVSQHCCLEPDAPHEDLTLSLSSATSVQVQNGLPLPDLVCVRPLDVHASHEDDNHSLVGLPLADGCTSDTALPDLDVFEELLACIENTSSDDLNSYKIPALVVVCADRYGVDDVYEVLDSGARCKEAAALVVVSVPLLHRTLIRAFEVLERVAGNSAGSRNNFASFPVRAGNIRIRQCWRTVKDQFWSAINIRRFESQVHL